jgi:hypothetical protein
MEYFSPGQRRLSEEPVGTARPPFVYKYCISYEGGMVTLLRDHVPLRGAKHGHATYVFGVSRRVAWSRFCVTMLS